MLDFIRKRYKSRTDKKSGSRATWKDQVAWDHLTEKIRLKFTRPLPYAYWRPSVRDIVKLATAMAIEHGEPGFHIVDHQEEAPNGRGDTHELVYDMVNYFVTEGDEVIETDEHGKVEVVRRKLNVTDACKRVSEELEERQKLGLLSKRTTSLRWETLYQRYNETFHKEKEKKTIDPEYERPFTGPTVRRWLYYHNLLNNIWDIGESLIDTESAENPVARFEGEVR